MTLHIFTSFFKMNAFILLIIIPSFIAADILCPDSKTSCPEGKQCCEADGVYSCCDAEDYQDVPDIRKKVYAGLEIMSGTVFENGSFSANDSTLQFGLMCDLFCSGTCCKEGCCSYSRATCCEGGCCPKASTCCGGNRCCPDLKKCCRDGCCPQTATCCGGNRCCPNLTQCCRNGCCPKNSKCCGNGCCSYGTICCGSWCCMEGEKCGAIYETCITKESTINKGVTTKGAIAVLWLAASLLVFHRF
ncbi:unnamed protein product [Larinioides sclopetarius]|uniref:Uncharacterized protein n=1 Tax=Larinioides sclopetarius TaxID=280406 RepID=A0AAV2A6E5_9ARAC